MKIDLSPRGSGKTTRAIEWLKKGENRLMLVMPEDEKRRIIKHYKLNPVIASRVLLFSQNLRSYPVDTEVFIDNAEHCIEQLVWPHRLAGISISPEVL